MPPPLRAAQVLPVTPDPLPGDTIPCRVLDLPELHRTAIRIHVWCRRTVPKTKKSPAAVRPPGELGSWRMRKCRTPFQKISYLPIRHFFDFHRIALRQYSV